MRQVLLFFIVIYVLSAPFSVQANKSVYEWALMELDYAREEKAQQLGRFCDNIHNRAAQVRSDDVMLNFFDVNNKYYTLAKNNSAPDKLKHRIEKLRKDMRDYYLKHYLSFYDILFINKKGDIFYTIRKESDYGQNVFSGKLVKSRLAKLLGQNPREEVFTDFHYYPASEEPAAFFIEPAYKGENHIGWFAMQCAINKVNSLFTGAEQLGATQEAFLANKDGYLLTEPSFVGGSTILKMRLDDKNIKTKFKEKKGHRTVTDYRGFRALTSFEVFHFLGTDWLVVVKVDESQIVTEHFKQHSKFYFEKLINHLETTTISQGDSKQNTEKPIMVDMDEFIKADHGELLKTVGVSTCTALIATYPGKFGYLAHMSPYDKMYGNNGTNLLGHIIKKIKSYDIYKYERRKVKFIVVARQLDSFENIINKLINEGFMLSQINVLFHPKAKCANVVFDYSDNFTCAEWLMDESRSSKLIQNTSEKNNLGAIVKQLLDD